MHRNKRCHLALQSNKWQAAINVMKRNIYLGSFESEIEAARVSAELPACE